MIQDSQQDANFDKGAVVCLSYNLSVWDILLLVQKIHAILLALPLVFLAGHIILRISSFSNTEAYVSFVLFALSLVCVVCIYLKQYYIFKKQYYFKDRNTAYHAEFCADGFKISMDEGKNLTEYSYSDFIRCREGKRKIYLYFRYDRAIIVKKQLFKKGDQNALRELLKNNFSNFRSKRL